MKQQFWKGKRVFVTGHTGFKGSWLSLWLQFLGANVTGYATNAPTTPNMFEIADVQRDMTSIIGDIRDLSALMYAVKESRPEIVIHMAAQPLVRYSYANPIETYSTNMMGTVNLLESVRQASGVRVVINVTTDKCYENKEWDWGYRENEPLGGYDPYSSSKACSELITSAYRQSFFNPQHYSSHGTGVASARAGNVIGGGDWAPDRLVPDVVRAIQSGEPVIIRSPRSIRPWQHVLEPLLGYLMLAQRLYTDGINFAESWNFGPNDDQVRSVQWVVEKINSLWGSQTVLQFDESSRVHEAKYLKLDCSKAKARLGWHPCWSLQESLENVVNWHKEHSDNKEMKKITMRQIATFSDRFNKDMISEK